MCAMARFIGKIVGRKLAHWLTAWAVVLLPISCGGSSKDAPSPSAGSSGSGAQSVGGSSYSASGSGSGGSDTSSLSTAGHHATNTSKAIGTASEIFAANTVLEYRLVIEAADLTSLEQHGDLEQYVPATLTVRGGVIGSLDLGRIGVRHKGDVSLHHCWNSGSRSYVDECAKLSYKLKLDEYVTDTRLFGLKHLNLHASSSDPTMLRELLSYGLFSEFGIVAPRAVPASLYINHEMLGLFIAVEEIDGRFTAMHFPSGGDGNLYKETWPRIGQPDGYFIDGLKTNNDTGSADVSDIQALSAVVGRLTAANFEQSMSAWFDVDNLLHYLAVDRAIKNWDGITAFYKPESPHNFYLYHDNGAQARFHLIPWDLHGTILELDPYMDVIAGRNQIPNINVAPASCLAISIWRTADDPGMTPPGCDPLLRYLAQTQWDKLTTIGNELLTGSFAVDHLKQRINGYSALIEPIIAVDPTIDPASWRGSVDQLPGTIETDRTDFAALLATGYVIGR